MTGPMYANYRNWTVVLSTVVCQKYNFYIPKHEAILVIYISLRTQKEVYYLNQTASGSVNCWIFFTFCAVMFAIKTQLVEGQLFQEQ